jgi:hypothetical protein
MRAEKHLVAITSCPVTDPAGIADTEVKHVTKTKPDWAG